MTTPYAARRTVTAVFCDVVGSTSLGARLDPETLHEVMNPYYDAMRAAVERHGGRVEKFIGDAVVGVFGAARISEDDALRAVRAADEMRASLVALNVSLRSEYAVDLEARIGVSTGEVVVQGGDTVVLGDVGNTAARLQAAAEAGEVLAADATHRLVRDAVSAAPLELTLKGKPGQTLAYRILAVHADAHDLSRRLDARMVGRRRERAVLAQAFARVCDTPESHVLTVAGEAGIGKSRLVAEHLDDVRGRATVATGRCLSYGEGNTLRPMVEILRGLVGPDLAHGLRELLGDDADAGRAADSILAAAGLAAAESGLEIWWGIRSVFAAAVGEAPIVVALEDIHWAEPALLDLIEYLADQLQDAPILFVCLARPELLEHRPGWGAGPARTVLHLKALSEPEALQLVDHLGGLGAAAQRRIVAAARGNPLFIEQMAALVGDVDAAPAEGALPPLLSALLAARLDRLVPPEREVLGAAAVEGEVFHRSSVAALTGGQDPGALGALLDRLGRLELIDPASSEFVGEDAFRFRHGLIRDAAYAAVSKRLRSSLHRRHADWLAVTAADRAGEYDEILGYHLERAFRLLEELGPITSEHLEIAESASTRLAAAGRRAFARGGLGCASCHGDQAEGLRGPSLAGGAELEEFRHVHGTGLFPPTVVTDRDFAAVNAWLQTLQRRGRG
jgi:class 3 adenylate cyclase/mono/diheme cytochrome c family protein